MSDVPFTIEYYCTSAGAEPVRRWIDHDLSNEQRRAVMAALKYLLAARGVEVCASEYGCHLGGGLVELRIRHGEREILRRADKPSPSRGRHGGILLRVFCHATAGRVVVLLGGYDKGRDPSRRRQAREIALARRRLRDYQRRRR